MPRARSWVVTPGVVSFVASHSVRARSAGLYRAVRRIDPVHESPIGIWLLSRHADVVTALRHPHMSVVEDHADESALNLGFVRLLARLEARVALRGLVDRLPDLRLAGGRPSLRPSFTIRGLSRLDLAWPAAVPAGAQSGGAR